jgi:hypothetical protein
MLTLYGRRRQFCDGVTRRDALRVGAAGIGGLTLAHLLRAEATAAPERAQRPKSIINIYLPGGPSHMDTFDLKPDAPAEFRGEFRPIDTSAPGVQISEHLPRLAQVMDRLVVIRSIAGLNDEHTSNQSDSGWSYNSLRDLGGRPSLGSVVARLHGSTSAGAPAFVQLGGGESSPGFLGPVYQPYRPDGPGLENLALTGTSLEQLDDRVRLRTSLDRLRCDLDASGTMDTVDTFTQRALSVVTSSALARAFDVSQEDPRVRERYVPQEYQQFGNNESFLLARRLVEAGVRCVSLWWGSWDTHGDNFNYLRMELPELDLGLSALVEDLDSRGLLADTMILVSGEFGRTPRINGGAGRDHWAPASFMLTGGGGMPGGLALGSTNRLGEQPQDRPIHIQEVFATLYHRLGIDVETTTLIDPNGRPQYLVDERQTIAELA